VDAHGAVDDARRSGSGAVEVLEELVSGELDLLVSPLGCPVLTSDQAHPVDATKVPVDECVSRLGVVVRTVGEPQMPCGVVIPRVRLQEGVLVLSARLDFSPHALEHVLVCVDEPSCVRNGVLVDRVRGHSLILIAAAHTDRGYF
jgi:hypothetical protein